MDSTITVISGFMLSHRYEIERVYVKDLTKRSSHL